jgi:uncharacterized protein (TIGR02246 family)
VVAQLHAQESEVESAYKEVSKLEQQYAKAWKNKDPDAMSRLFTKSGNHVSSTGVKTSKPKNISSLYTKVFTSRVSEKSHYFGKSIGVQLLKKDIGILDVTATQVATVDGKFFRIDVRYTIVAQKVDKQWRIAAIRFATPEFPTDSEK